MKMKSFWSLFVLVILGAALYSKSMFPRSTNPSKSVYSPTWSTAADDNASIPIIRASDPSKVSETITSGNVTIGFDNDGGGYINSVRIGDGGNMVESDYGKGWQSAIRDRLHNGRYNPTQAGFVDHAGAFVRAYVDNNRLIIPKFRLPLFGDPVYDFTQNEDLYPDFAGYPDHNNSDKDGIPETGSTQDNEVRSDFTYGGQVEDISSETYNRIPGFRQTFYYAYSETPKAILQFGPAGVLEDGTKVIQDSARLQDLSESMPGDQTATDIDLSTGIFETLGIRINKAEPVTYDYRYPMSWQNGNWNVGKDVLTNTYPALQFMNSNPYYKNTNHQNSIPLITKNTDLPMAILSDGTDPNSGHAIGLYFPSKGMNAKPVVGIHKADGSIAYAEDRRLRSQLTYSYNPSVKQIVLRPVIYFSGLLAPTHTPSGVIEAIYNESIVLFGTPNEILQTVLHMESAHK